MDMMSLNNKVVLITGAGHKEGQGAGEAHLLSELGAEVWITDITGGDGRELAASIGSSVHYLDLDVSSAAQWQTVTGKILDKHGRIDALVNNAGIWSGEGILDTDPEQFRRVFEINQLGVFLGMQTVGRIMCSANTGSIVNVSSIAAMRVGLYYWHHELTAHAYTATKWAVRGMSRAAAMEFAPHKVRVNAIFPGPIDTGMLGHVDREQIAGDIPAGRLGSVTEVANTVAFLISDACNYMSGAELAIDGALAV